MKNLTRTKEMKIRITKTEISVNGIKRPDLAEEKVNQLGDKKVSEKEFQRYAEIENKKEVKRHRGYKEKVQHGTKKGGIERIRDRQF